MTPRGFALTFRLVPGEEPRRREFDNRTAALGFRYGVTHWACSVSDVVELDRYPLPWFRPGPGAPVLETVPVAPRYVPDEGEESEDYEGGIGAILDGSVAGAAEEDDNG